MSMGDGDLHLKCEALEIKLEKAQADRDAYKRQLGGTTAAMNRVKDANGKLCAEVNRQERRIRELESLLRDLYDNLWVHQPKCAEAFSERMAELGLEIG